MKKFKRKIFRSVLDHFDFYAVFIFWGVIEEVLELTPLDGLSVLVYDVIVVEVEDWEGREEFVHVWVFFLVPLVAEVIDCFSIAD